MPALFKNARTYRPPMFSLFIITVFFFVFFCYFYRVASFAVFFNVGGTVSKASVCPSRRYALGARTKDEREKSTRNEKKKNEKR